MHLSHINITMPKGREDIARQFYVGQLRLAHSYQSRCESEAGGLMLVGLMWMFRLKISAGGSDTQRILALSVQT